MDDKDDDEEEEEGRRACSGEVLSLTQLPPTTTTAAGGGGGHPSLLVVEKKRGTWRLSDEAKQRLIAFCVGVVHGSGAPGGVLGVLPAVQVRRLIRTCSLGYGGAGREEAEEGRKRRRNVISAAPEQPQLPLQ